MTNKRIKELANKAGYNDQIYEISKEGLDKFAKLIALECASVCESMQLIGPYKDVQDATLKDASSTIKQHFGVEE